MNQHVRHLYVAIRENRVIHASTGLSEFYRTMSAIVTGMKSRSYYEKEFQKTDIIKHRDYLDKVYWFQKVK